MTIRHAALPLTATAFALLAWGCKSDLDILMQWSGSECTVTGSATAAGEPLTGCAAFVDKDRGVFGIGVAPGYASFAQAGSDNHYFIDRPAAGTVVATFGRGTSANQSVLVSGNSGDVSDVRAVDNAAVVVFFPDDSGVGVPAGGSLGIGSYAVTTDSDDRASMHLSLTLDGLTFASTDGAPLGTLDAVGVPHEFPSGNTGGGPTGSTGSGTCSSQAACDSLLSECSSDPNNHQASCYCAAACACKCAGDTACEDGNRTSASGLGTACSY